MALLQAARASIGPKRTGEMIGYSAPVVIAVCDGTYPANPARVREAVEAHLGAATVPCPVLGDLALTECRRYRTAEFSPSNPVRARLYRTCPRCPFNPASKP